MVLSRAAWPWDTVWRWARWRARLLGTIREWRSLNHEKSRQHASLSSLIALGSLTSAVSGGQISGELKTWHKVTITFDGPQTSERAEPNPFTDYRLNVTFSKGEKTFLVPGYYAADGDAANTGADSGNKWRVHFAPSEPGAVELSRSRSGRDPASPSATIRRRRCRLYGWRDRQLRGRAHRQRRDGTSAARGGSSTWAGTTCGSPARASTS